MYGEAYMWLTPSSARYGTRSLASRNVKPALNWSRYVALKSLHFFVAPLP